MSSDSDDSDIEVSAWVPFAAGKSSNAPIDLTDDAPLPPRATAKAPMPTSSASAAAKSKSKFSAFDDLISDQQSVRDDASARMVQRTAAAALPLKTARVGGAHGAGAIVPPAGHSSSSSLPGAGVKSSTSFAALLALNTSSARSVSPNPSAVRLASPAAQLSESRPETQPQPRQLPVPRQNYGAPKPVQIGGSGADGSNPPSRSASPAPLVAVTRLPARNDERMSVKRAKLGTQTPSQDAVNHAFALLDELKDKGQTDWQERFQLLALSWDLNQFHRESLAGPPVPPFASMSNFIANQSKDAAASSNLSSSGQSRADATTRLLTDPSSYISFASEREYVVFFEFLLVEDLKARVMGAAQDKRGHAVSARLSKWYPLKNQSFVELCAFAPDADVKNWSSQDLVLIELDTSASLVRPSSASSSSSSSSKPTIVQETHLVALVQSVDSAAGADRRRAVRLRIFPIHDHQAVGATRHLARMSNFLSALGRLAPPSSSSSSSSLSSSSATATASASKVEITLRITHLESITTSMREYLALHALPETFVANAAKSSSSSSSSHSHGHHSSHASNPGSGVCDAVRRDILQPGPRPKLERPSAKHSIVHTLPPALQAHLVAEMNETQMAAVRASCLTSSVPFVLLQGPPGTGKTKVVIKILNVLHLHFYLLHYDSLVRTLSARIQKNLELSSADSSSSASSASSASRSSQLWATKTIEQIAAEVRVAAGVTPKPRILVCAPSNAAVDEIIERLTLLKLLDGDLNKYDADMVRVGNSDKMRDAVNAQISLEAQVERYLSMGVEALTVAKTAAKKGLTACQLDLRHMEEYARTNHAKLFAEHADMGARMAFSSDLVRQYDALQRHRLELERCNIVVDCGLDRNAARDRLQVSILNNAQIVFSTLSGAGMRCLAELERGFDRCIVDEAGQCVELSVLIPLRLQVRSCILVGDPRQLPATCFLNGPIAKLYERSLFERLEQAGYPVHMLQTQYRMHPEICVFPSDHFYQSKLRNAASVSGPSHSAFFHQDDKFAPFLYWDLEGHESSVGHSMSNALEARFIAEHIAALLRAVPPERRAHLIAQVGVITPYNQQRIELQRATEALLPADLCKALEVATVDSFQGREKDVIIISCVRALSSTHAGGIGFVADRRRLNVAVTRARLALWIVGDSRSLDRSPDWRALIDNAIARRCYRRAVMSGAAASSSSSSSSSSSRSQPKMSRREQDYWVRQEEGRRGGDGGVAGAASGGGGSSLFAHGARPPTLAPTPFAMTTHSASAQVSCQPAFVPPPHQHQHQLQHQHQHQTQPHIHPPRQQHQQHRQHLQHQQHQQVQSALPAHYGLPQRRP